MGNYSVNMNYYVEGEPEGNKTKIILLFTIMIFKNLLINPDQ
jgi:hypothetical protein